MLDPLIAGLLAGWGVAIPLGAIGVMIVDLGMRGGFRPAAAAAAGVATADFLYAAVAAAAGAAVAGALAPHEDALRLAAASVLGVVALAGLRVARRAFAADTGRPATPASGPATPAASPDTPATGSATAATGSATAATGSGTRARERATPAPRRASTATFVRFVALTSINPLTVAYFAALIAGLPAVASASAGAKAVFVLAAGAASLSWQLVLAGAGAVLHHRLPPSARLYTALAGNAIVLALALRMAVAA
jgi:arginine exporter protein ArgO